MWGGGIASTFLTSALDGGERSASHPGRFDPVKEPSEAELDPERV
jgi:hypothetical protein